MLLIPLLMNSNIQAHEKKSMPVEEYEFAGNYVTSDLIEEIPSDNKSTFNQQRWLTGTPRVRGEMAESVLKGKKFIGKTPKDVIAILGQPDEQSPDQFSYRVDLGNRPNSASEEESDALHFTVDPKRDVVTDVWMFE
jgi:hypothetical protein